MSERSPKDILQNLIYHTYLSHLKAHEPGAEPNDLYIQSVHDFELPLIRAVLEYTQGNMTQTAKILGISRTTLSKKKKKIDEAL